MKLEEAMSKALYNYPSLFYHKPWKWTRQSILGQLFITLGNGMGWHKETGVMIEADEAEYSDFNEEGWCYNGKLTEELPLHMLTENNYEELLDALPLRPPSDFAIDLWERFGKKVGDEYPTPKCDHSYLTDGDEGWTPYGILQAGKILHLPDNIEKTWLEGAKEITLYLREFYEAGLDDRRNTLNYEDRGDLSEYLVRCLEAVEKIEDRIKEIEGER